MSQTARPIGVIPQWMWESDRIKTLLDAMNRYNEAIMPVPQAWADELQELQQKQRAWSAAPKQEG